MKITSTTTAALLAATAAAALLVPALAQGHAVVSTMQPQGPALTAARTLFVLRVPNERPDRGTYKVRMAIPPAIQEAVSFKRVPGWSIALSLKDTGKKDEEGAPIEAVTAVTWTAKTRGDEIDPHFFGEFEFRAQNPTAAQQLCFPTVQMYRKSAKRRKGGEVVRWTGPATSETPASCLDVVAGS